MKKLISACLSLLLFCAAYYQTPVSAAGISADSLFDEFSIKTPWNEQKFRLDQFAGFLEQNSDYVGYI